MVFFYFFLLLLCASLNQIDSHMATKNHPVTYSTPSSYTLDDAVAHLLGLLKRGFVKSEIKVTLSGVAEEDLNKLSRLPGSLNEHLIALMNAANYEGNTNEVARIDQLLKDADIYMQYLTDEIAKGSDSAIRIDQDATQETGVRHYTLKSINDWFNANKSALDAATNTMTSGSTEAPLTEKSKQTLHLMIALLSKALIKNAKHPKPYLNGETPKISGIAAEIESLAPKPGGNAINGLGSDNLRIILSESFKVLSNLSK